MRNFITEIKDEARQEGRIEGRIDGRIEGLVGEILRLVERRLLSPASARAELTSLIAAGEVPEEVGTVALNRLA